LDFVITPVDNLIVEHGSYSLSLYKFVVGETMWERTPNAAQMAVAGRSFAQLHRTVRKKGPFEREETFAIDFADAFHQCIERLTSGSSTGASHEVSLREKLAPFISFILGEYERLLAQSKVVSERDVPFVNCHGRIRSLSPAS
jgi:hypothetical protein